MKRMLSVLLIVALLLTVTACGGNSTPPASSSEAAPPASTAAEPSSEAPAESEPASEPAAEGGELTGNYDLILATGGTGGTYYPFGGAMANVFQSHLSGVTCTATSTGASAENARLMNSNEADLSILQNDVMDYAYNGTEIMAEGGALQNIATIATLYPEVIQIVVSVESGINSIEDMAGKRISVGDSGSGTEANARQILGIHGITYDDMQVSYLSFAESSTGIQNKTLDGAFITAGVPNASITELSNMAEVKLLTISADKAAELIAQYPFYATYSVADDAYEKMAGGDTVAILATLACSADLDEELVYHLTKTLFENQPELAQAHAKGAELDINNAITGVSVPFHPGAARYYQEQGLSVG